MNMRSWSFSMRSLLLTSLLSSCVLNGTSDEQRAQNSAQSNSEAIQAGMADTQSDEAVGLLWRQHNNSVWYKLHVDFQIRTCSGTLIASDVALTSANCLVDESSGTTVPFEVFLTGDGQAEKGQPYWWQVPFGAKTPIPSNLKPHQVDHVLVHPDYQAGSSCKDGSHNIGLVFLAEPERDIHPMPYAIHWVSGILPPFHEGDNCKVVGFGKHTENILNYPRLKARGSGYGLKPDWVALRSTSRRP